MSGQSIASEPSPDTVGTGWQLCRPVAEADWHLVAFLPGSTSLAFKGDRLLGWGEAVVNYPALKSEA